MNPQRRSESIFQFSAPNRSRIRLTKITTADIRIQSPKGFSKLLMHSIEQFVTPNIALRSLHMLSKLDDDAIDTLATKAKLQCFASGTILFCEGEQHDWFYFIRSGLARLDMLTAHCGRQTILSIGNGDILAWSSLVGGRIMTASAVAVEDTHVVAFHAAELLELFQTRTDLGFQIMQVVAQSLSRRLLATRLQLLDLYKG